MRGSIGRFDMQSSIQVTKGDFDAIQIIKGQIVKSKAVFREEVRDIPAFADAIGQLKEEATLAENMQDESMAFDFPGATERLKKAKKRVELLERMCLSIHVMINKVCVLAQESRKEYPSDSS
ncbi:hypothetical protein OCU04_012000 [Sclerotinia nivalis]|uniref:Uncharacterized protein n=1 Tax=Sclerotinia nivalis TaxID=352851 RepID=A0A9X0AA04_9HELO|nr:hypothetical protein OCU04_012000 [Sclerotinia nivalis]